MRVLSVLYLTEHRSRLSVKKANLVVSSPDGTTSRVPVETLEAVVLFAGQVTTQALELCVEHGVRLAALRRNGAVRFTVGAGTNGNVNLRVAQLRAADDLYATAAIARAVVAGKLQSYRNLLHRWSWDAHEPERTLLLLQREALTDRVRSLPGVVDGDRIRGLEGDGTRRYFKGLSAHIGDRAGLGHFLLRSRRPPRDPVNALLGFLYGLVLTEVVGALEAIGLDPQVGFLHGLRPGRPSLALDLLEEFRPAIADRLAVRLICRRQLRIEHFTHTGAGAWFLSDEGRREVLNAYDASKEDEVAHRLLGRSLPVWTLPTVQATLLARHLRGDIPAYPPFVLSS